MCLGAAMTRIIKGYTARISEKGLKLSVNIHTRCQSQGKFILEILTIISVGCLPLE